MQITTYFGEQLDLVPIPERTDAPESHEPHSSVFMRLDDGTLAEVPVNDILNKSRWAWWNSSLPIAHTGDFDRYTHALAKASWQRYAYLTKTSYTDFEKPVKKTWRQVKTRQFLSRWGII